jgi:hypothetical protein
MVPFGRAFEQDPGLDDDPAGGGDGIDPLVADLKSGRRRSREGAIRLLSPIAPAHS